MLGKLIRAQYKRSVIWIALAASIWVVTSSAQAIGLGRIVVNSSLNEPLEAEISIASIESDVLDSLEIRLATDSDFRRANISIEPVVKLLRFDLISGETGPWIHVTTDSPVRSPFLHFLAAIEWSGGKIIREYTAMLNPPAYDVVVGQPISLPSTSDQRVIQPGDTYESVASGETLMGIATKIDVDQNVTIYQRMFALMHINSEAFIRGNMNLLREGSSLIIPSTEMMAGISKILAREEYSRQLSDWLGYQQGIEQGRAQSGQRLWVSLSPGKETIIVKEVKGFDAKEVPVERDVVREVEHSKVSQIDQNPPSDSDVSTTGPYVLRIVQPIADIQSEKVGKDTNSVVDPADQSAINSELEKVRNRLILTEEALTSKGLENEQLLRQITLLSEQIDKSSKIIALQDEALALAEQQATLRSQKVVMIDSEEGSNESDGEDTVESSNDTAQTSILANTRESPTLEDKSDQTKEVEQESGEGDLSPTTNESDGEVTVESSNDTAQTSILAKAQEPSTSEYSPDQADATEQELHFSKNKQLLLIFGVAGIALFLIVVLIRRVRQQTFQSIGNLEGGGEEDTMTTTTQLDLARAYIEMGDNSAARNVLDEVAQHGNANQKANARGLLAKLQIENSQ